MSDLDHLRARMFELEAQRDDYLNREWIAVKARKAAEAKLADLLDALQMVAGAYPKTDEGEWMAADVRDAIAAARS